MSARRARVRTAVRMVMRRRLRSALAAGGVAVALASLLIAITIAERGRVSALQDIRRMGATVLTVTAESSRNRGTRGRTGSVVRTLTLRDARDVEGMVPGVIAVAAEYRSVVPVKSGGLARQATVAGIEPSYASIREAPLAAGRFFEPGDETAGDLVAVLGARIAQDLFEGRAALGQSIRLGGLRFAVIGILPERGTGLDAFNEDEVVFIPLKTARRRLFQADYVHRLFIRADPGADLSEVELAVAAVLRIRHRETALDPVDFRVQDQRRLVTLRGTVIKRLGAFEITATVALLATGACGIFALQQFAVRERRAEIGTRRALGATRSMVFAQFLIEAGLVTGGGAVWGILLGTWGARMAGGTVQPSLAVLGFVACLAAGLVAAIQPARAAASLSPAAALRG